MTIEYMSRISKEYDELKKELNKKIMKKLQQLILKLKQTNLKFSLPSKNNLMIFDDVSIDDLKYVLKISSTLFFKQGLKM